MRASFKSRAKVKTLPHGVVGSLDAEYASIAQLEEHCADNAGVRGSYPLTCTIAHCATPFFSVTPSRISSHLELMSMIEMTKSKSEDTPAIC